MRQEGYYWVKYKENWIVALCMKTHWFLPGIDKKVYTDSDFSKINENRIHAPDEKPENSLIFWHQYIANGGAWDLQMYLKRYADVEDKVHPQKHLEYPNHS
jgi:hypothetical protein